MEPELMALGTEKLHPLSKRPNKRRSLKNKIIYIYSIRL